MDKTWRIVIGSHGEPEVMSWQEAEIGDPGEGQIRVKIEAAGLNYIDVYHRTGLYPVELPSGIGLEGAGTVTAAGAGSGFAEGDRVAFCTAGLGSYALDRLMDASKAVRLPDSIGFDEAAAMMLKGMTAEYLIRRTFPLKPGDVAVFHAAAGGVGQIACQWIKLIGASVIAVVGSEEKASIAEGLGCDLTLVRGRDDVPARVKRFTGGRGAQVVYDSVGKDTFDESLASLAPRGMLVSFGNASGPVEPFTPLALAAAGSLYVTRPTLMDYVKEPAELAESASCLFDAVGKGVKVEIGMRYPMRKAADAHRALEERRTTGSTILLP